jgi:hypothetical protein
VSKKIVIASIVGVAVAGLGAILLLDEPPGSEKAASVGRGSEARPAPDRGFDPIPPAPGPQEEGDGALTAEQLQRLRAALEKMAAEGATREALSGGVTRPWPVEVAKKEYEACLAREKGARAPNFPVTNEQVCSCATRVVQEVFPEERPQPGTRTLRRAYERTYRQAVAGCLGEN